MRSPSSLRILDRVPAPAGALARCWRCRWWWEWSAARGGRRRCAGQVPVLQVVADVASSARPLAARWPGAGAAGRGGRGQQLDAAAGGALARSWRCRSWWTWPAA
ncbi:hypothetical protein L7Q78_05080 [Achromobacter xylosoxidans]|nr:hypothetical protein [Achromobacter xylosoxidans]